jgi:hypothetical protein
MLSTKNSKKIIPSVKKVVPSVKKVVPNRKKNNSSRKISTRYATKFVYDLYETKPINFLVKYNNNDKNEFIIKPSDPYLYESLNTNNQQSASIKVTRNDLFDKIGHDSPVFDQYLKNAVEIAEGFARGVSKYISSNFKGAIRVSNAFCKLWEIYNIVDNIFPLKENPNIFYVAEAPGQWINASNHYYKIMYANKKSKKYEINWFANTLNPYHPINIEKFGPIFADDYGFIKNNKDKWLYGEDQTGDIFSSKNQKWYHDFAQSKEKFDLVTGDAGLHSKSSIESFQKLEYACAFMTAGLSSIGGNCIMKHFLPLVNFMNGYFVNYLYLYYLLFDELRLVKPVTSNPSSAEFYVVCKGFKGISPSNYEKLLDILDIFKENMCIFDKKDIPDGFVDQLSKFYKLVTNKNNKHKNIRNRVLTCKINARDKIKLEKDCNLYLNKKIIKDVQNKLFKKWVHDNKFKV